MMCSDRADKAEPGAAGEPGVCQPSSQLVIQSLIQCAGAIAARRFRGSSYLFGSGELCPLWPQ